jgi:hypothetical protein
MTTGVASHARRSWLRIGIPILAVIIAVAGLTVWRVGHYWNEEWACPSVEWSEQLVSEIRAIAPDGAGIPHMADCDDRRAVELEVEVGAAAATVAQQVEDRATQSGWVPAGDGGCWEKEVDGYTAWLGVVAENEQVRLLALRGGC